MSPTLSPNSSPRGEESALRRLELDGLILRAGASFRTTRRWQGAMARAALHLYRVGEQGSDLRIPIVCALLELYGMDEPPVRIADLTEAILPIEAKELSPRSER